MAGPGRPQKFSNGKFKLLWNKYDGNINRIAKRLGCSVPTVYNRARSLGLKTPNRDMSLRPTDLALVHWFTVGVGAMELSERLNIPKPTARYQLMVCVRRVWHNDAEPNFPQPRNPSEVQVFNAMRQLHGEKDEFGAPLNDDIDAIAEKSGLGVHRIEPYHRRYLEHQIGLEEQPRKPKGRRAKKARAGRRAKSSK